MIAAPPEPSAPPRREVGKPREHSPWRYRQRLWIAAAAAMAVHATVYFFSGKSLVTGIEFGMEDPTPSVDVELVERAATEPAAATPPPAPEPPKPEPVPEPPKPEPEPEPPKPKPEPPKPDEMAPPKPEPTPKPKPAATPTAKPRAVAKPAAAPSRPASAAATASSGTPGAAGGAAGGRTSGPGHLFNPKPAYPPESRAAGEHGMVLLRVRVESDGRPGSVSLARSSGYPRLDRAAQEAVRRWRFKPATRDGQAFAATVDVPVRFSLR